MIFRTGAIAGVIFALTAIAALAHGGATGIVKERMELMMDIAAEMKTVAQMIRGKRPFDAEVATDAAMAIAEHAEAIPEKFPEGTIRGPSEAVPEIWESWDEFVRLSEELKTKAEALSVAAKSAADAAELSPEFRDVGSTCMACHEDFRQPG